MIHTYYTDEQVLELLEQGIDNAPSIALHQMGIPIPERSNIEVIGKMGYGDYKEYHRLRNHYRKILTRMVKYRFVERTNRDILTGIISYKIRSD